MEDAVPTLPRNSHKTQVVVVLADSIAALDLSQGSAATYYINLLLRRLSVLSKRVLVAFVTYGLLHCNGPPISVTEFSAKRKLKRIPAGETIVGGPLSMVALDGYVVAFKLFDAFQTSSGQGSKEQFSYHLWHVAAGQHDGAETSRFDFSPTLWGVRWETVPTEIKKRDISLSMILLGPCLKFSDVFNATSSTPIEPWFRKCPHHTILLSGFASSPDRGGRIPAKRPAEDPAEKDCPRSRTRRALSEPTLAPALAPVKEQHEAVDQWSGTLIWPGEKSDVRLQVLAVDMVRHPNIATLPTSLRVEIFESGTQTRDFQAYILEKKLPMVRIKYASCETDANEFEGSVKSLRMSRCLAIARCEARGKDSPLSSLLLAPLNEDLLCAILPTSNPQDLPKARPNLPPEEEQPEVDYPPSAGETSPVTWGNTESLRGEPFCPDSHPAAFAMGTLDFRQLPPQQSQYPQQQQQQQQHPPPYHPQEQLSQPQAQQCQQHPPPYHSQGQLPQPHAQQCQQPASSDTPSALLPDGFDPFDSGFSGLLTENAGPGQTHATATLDVRQIPPQQFQFLQQQHPPPYDYQGQQSQPQAQQCRQPASPDKPPTLPDGVNSFDSGLFGLLTENSARVGFGQTDAYPYAMDVGQGLHGRGVDEVLTSLTMPGHPNELETQQFMFQQYQRGPGYPNN